MVCSTAKCANLKYSMLPRLRCVVSLLGLALASMWLEAQSQPPAQSDFVGEVFASDASVQGSVIFASGGTRLLSGSTVSSGAATTALRLKRGGEVRVCPGSNVQVNSVVNQIQERNLVLSLDVGGLETHYSLPSGSDSVVTPDFRITLVGPGNFHVAIGADAHGNTCVQPLRGNNAALIVNELMGEGSYQVRPNQGVYFRNGRVKDAVADVPACGCPLLPAPRAVETAQQPAPAVAPEKVAPEKAADIAANQPEPESVTQPPPPVRPNDVEVHVDAPMVFNAAEPGPALEAEQLVQLPLTQLPWFSPEPVAPPAVVRISVAPLGEKPREKKKGFFGRLRGMFAAIFGK